MEHKIDLEKKAKNSLILGVIGMVAWLLPLAGFPVTIVGIVAASKGLKSKKRGLALAGLILSIIGLVLTMINAFWGAYLGATGQHALLQ